MFLLCSRAMSTENERDFLVFVFSSKLHEIISDMHIIAVYFILKGLRYIVINRFCLVFRIFRSKEKNEKNNNSLDDGEADGEEILSSKHFMELKNDIEEKESTIKTLQKRYVHYPLLYLIC